MSSTPPPTTLPTTKPISISLSSAPKPKAPPKPTKPPPFASSKRALNDSDDEYPSDDDDHRGKVQLLTGLNSKGKAVTATKEKKKERLVIPTQKNVDWRAEAMKRKAGRKGIYVPEGAKQGEVNEEDLRDRGNDEERVWGLEVIDRTRTTTTTTTEDGTTTEVKEEEEVRVEKTEEQQAIDALLGKAPAKEGSKLVIATHDDGKTWNERVSEADLYKADVSSRPDAPSLEAYEAIPVEEFGMAMLRGMGWKEGMQVGRRRDKATPLPKKVTAPPEKRPALLGLGAKPQAAVAQELGVWGKADVKKNTVRKDAVYTPVLLKDKRTGEIIDEAEKERREKEAKEKAMATTWKRDKAEDGGREERDGRRDRSRERDSRRDRDRSRDRGHRGDKDRDSRRRDEDEYRSKDRHREKDRDRDYEKSSSRRHRDDERSSRRRDDDRDRGKDRDRDSRRDRDRHRDSGRDRDGDRDRRRDRDRY
ncbi:hypothetical protein BJ508DRAFT_39508 [Ascobolus immersus RN42]|uniref:Pre-mRNA-splicing factor n=1 Tax=Ascobolus immersus RN42 TaxID=1160509 RepID=A0A3N4HK26_ASCIM|nr:hypothetical protein BJ508DRAFT_39508 [Ascobolus immersus RN42]